MDRGTHYPVKGNKGNSRNVDSGGKEGSWRRPKKQHGQSANRRRGLRDLEIIWKNAQSLKSRGRQGEFNAWMKGNKAAIVGVSETWLKGGEYVEVDDDFVWIGKNRKHDAVGGGGVGLCIRRDSNLVYEEIKGETEDVILIRVKEKGKQKWEYLIGVVYFEVEGRQDGWGKNVRITEYVNQEVIKAKREKQKVMIGGDFNGHIYELDGREDRNGRLVKLMAEDNELELLNCTIEGMDRHTWERGDLQTHIDYVLMCEEGKNVLEAGYVTEIGEGVGIDHAGVGVILKVGKKGKITRERGAAKKRKKCLTNVDWETFGNKVDEEIINREPNLTSAIMTVANEMLEPDESKGENRMAWVDEDLKQSILRRQAANRELRKTRKKYGKNSPLTAAEWEKYQKAKQASSDLVAEKRREHDRKTMKAIREGRNADRDMWKHIKSIMDKERKPKRGCTEIKMTSESGEEIVGVDNMKREIERFWGSLFCTTGVSILGISKEKLLEGMAGLEEVQEGELDKVIKELKNGKATGEDEIAGEYLKNLKEISRECLRAEINGVFGGGAVPETWKKSRVTLIPKGEDKDNVTKYRPIAIMSVICKVAMMIIRNRLSRVVEEVNFLGHVQGGFRKNRRTEDNLYILERIIEITKARNDRLFLAFLDLEKAYDRVNRDKLFEILREYGIGEDTVRLLQNIYTGSKVKFVWKGIETDWVETKSGVRQGCPLSPLLFNIYVREVGTVIETSGLGFKYPIINDGNNVDEWGRIAGLLYADDIVLVAKTEEELQQLLFKVGTVASEYGLSFSETKSKVIRINEDSKQETWQVKGKTIAETESYRYLGVDIKGGKDGYMDSMKGRLQECRKVVGMIKFTASRAGDRLIVGRQAWKGLAVGKLMYGSGALAGELKEINGMDRMQNEMGRWLWWSGRNVSNALIRGETGWSTFKEREAKAKLDWVCRIMFEDGPVSKIGRATIAELGTVSRWWRRVNEIAHMVGLDDIINLIALRRVNENGLQRLGLTTDRKIWKGELADKVKKWGQRKWREDMGNSDEMREYRQQKKLPYMEEYAQTGEGARTRMLLRGGYLPLRGNRKFLWRNRDERCRCGEPETEDHFLFQCELYAEVHRDWGVDYGGQPRKQILKGYIGDENQNKTAIKFLERMWRKRCSLEKDRVDPPILQLAQP